MHGEIRQSLTSQYPLISAAASRARCSFHRWSLLEGGHGATAERAEGLLGIHDQSGTGSTGDAVAAGAEDNAGWLVQTNDAGVLIVFLMCWHIGDCLSHQCHNRAQLL